MSLLTLFWAPGKRTITLSVLAGIIAILLQADFQEVINIAPLIKLVLQFGLTLMLPLIPIYLRKGIESGLNK